MVGAGAWQERRRELLLDGVDTAELKLRLACCSRLPAIAGSSERPVSAGVKCKFCKKKIRMKYNMKVFNTTTLSA